MDMKKNVPIRAAVVVASDKAAKGLREDLSGPALAAMLEGNGIEVTGIYVLPDERAEIAARLRALCGAADIIFTSGGTGFAPRDVTPEATLDVVERIAPGIPEAMRAFSMQKTNRAMLSRAVAGIHKNTLIINMPGSPKAVRECMEVILPVLDHAVETLRGETYECGR